MQTIIIKILAGTILILSSSLEELNGQCTVIFNKSDSIYYIDSSFVNKANCFVKYPNSSIGDTIMLTFKNGRISEITTYHPNGQLNSQTKYTIDGKIENDSIIVYRSNGTIDNLSYYDTLGQITKRIVYERTGTIPQIIQYFSNYQTITREYISKDVLLSETFSYTNSYSIKFSYYPTGQLMFEMVTLNGFTTWKTFEYYANNKIKVISYYQGSEVNGYQLYYNKRGKLIGKKYFGSCDVK